MYDGWTVDVERNSAYSEDTTRCCERQVDSELGVVCDGLTRSFAPLAAKRRIGVVCDGWTRSKVPLAAKRRLGVVCEGSPAGASGEATHQ